MRAEGTSTAAERAPGWGAGRAAKWPVRDQPGPARPRPRPASSRSAATTTGAPQGTVSAAGCLYQRAGRCRSAADQRAAGPLRCCCAARAAG